MIVECIESKKVFGARQLYRECSRIVWTSQDLDGNRFVALFNTGEERGVVSVQLENLDSRNPVSLRNLWAREDLGVVEHQIAFELDPHQTVLRKLTEAAD